MIDCIVVLRLCCLVIAVCRVNNIREIKQFYGRYHDLVDRYGIYVSQMTMDWFRLSFSHSRLITGFVTRLTRRMLLVEQKLLTLRGTCVYPRF